MDKGQDLGMQPKALERIVGRPVFFVADHRMADVLHVYTDLVLPTGLQVEPERANSPDCSAWSDNG